MTAPVPIDLLATWTPRAALGPTCPGCHPEHRDGTSPARPDARVEAVSDGREEARRPMTGHEVAAPTAAL